MLRILSPVLFPHFLFLVGLNFIKVASGAVAEGPASLFADRIEGAPAHEFYDVLRADGSIWMAGDGLFRLQDGLLQEVFSDERYSALAWDRDLGSLWFATSDSIGLLNPADGSRTDIPVGNDFIWDLHLSSSQLWYFGSRGYGKINTTTLRAEKHIPHDFTPRPFFLGPAGQPGHYWISDESGLWSADENGVELILEAELLNGQLLTWMEADKGGYLMGTAENIFRWTGEAGSLPRFLESNYGNYFGKGINNSAGFPGQVAVVDYPFGVALVDRSTGVVSPYVPAVSSLEIGDLFKVRKSGPASLLMMGSEGLATVNLDQHSRFFSGQAIFSGKDYRDAVATGNGALVFLDTGWADIDADHYTAGELYYTASWVGLDRSGRPICGVAYGYEEFRDGTWHSREMSIPVTDFLWGTETAYAIGPDGAYAGDEDLVFRQIYPDSRRLELLGEVNNRLFLLRGDREVVRLDREGSTWRATPLPLELQLDAHAHASGTSALWLASGENLYRLGDGEPTTYSCAPGWQVGSISTSGEEAAFLYFNPSTGEMAVGILEGEEMTMLSVPYLERLGEPLGLVCNEDRVGVIGTGGLGWYAREELALVGTPEVEFDLLLENRRIEDRTIPSGMHFIDLQVDFADSRIPCQVEYRINEQRWRGVNLSDPSLTFAGHGNFTVELRAIHPNGNVSEPQMVQFGIAPPWYFNPLYQGVMLILALLLAWGLFYIRSAQLKKTNLWLQGEVKKQTRELEAATAARTNFLAGLSHDIRNPLNGVLMIAETLSRNPPKDGEDSRLKDLTEFGIIVDRMLGEILDFSAIDERNIPTSFIPVSLPDIIESSIKQNQFGIRKELVTMQTNISPELKEVIIRTDRNWMIKILSNLIINALEYSESDRIEVGAICHKLTPTEVELEVYVADWGKGIDPSEREYVFERFYRGESGIESGKHGTGLGLSICQEIAHAMGAHLQLQDNEPTGCRFILKGKFDRVESGKELDKEAVLAQLRGKRVLVVDDLAYNRRSVIEFFRTLGCQCDESENGRQALAMLEENDYYLALLDWDLPGLTGPEIARRHRKARPDDPVILLSVTAYTDAEKRHESVDAGMHGYISKPLTASRLAHCLANIEDLNLPDQEEDSTDVVDADELMEEIYNHIEDCLLYGERYEWENLRRCAHRLTTLALIRNNKAMQQVCRDIQVAASEGNREEAQVSLLELYKWRRP